MNKREVCAICSKPVSGAYKPFCSKRCADVDLNRWLSENYAVPGQEDESADERAVREAQPVH